MAKRAPTAGEEASIVAPLPRPHGYGRWILTAVPLIVISLVATWFATRDTLPPVIRIATAVKGGQYYRYATALAQQLEKRTARTIEVLETHGSVKNRELLRSGEAELAILQLGTIDMHGLTTLAPLYSDVLHVIVREGRGINSIHELVGKSVILGPPGSGMRASALELLAHYDIRESELRNTDGYFRDLVTNRDLDAALVTTGYLNPDLKEILHSGGLRLLPIHDAEAIALTHSYLTPTTIPRGLYRANPPVPAVRVPTLATDAVLAAREDVSRLLVTHTLSALFEGNLREDLPDMTPMEQVRTWSKLRLHPATRSYFNPNEQLRVVGAFIDSLAAIKELLFAFGAGIYGLWLWRRRKNSSRKHRELAHQKSRLDKLLMQTVRIERAQMGTEDSIKLRAYLDDVTRIKLKALGELSHEELRGDRVFSIFLMQCSNLIRKIQSKLSLYAKNPPSPKIDSEEY